MSTEKFICCPQCGSQKTEPTDYEDENGDEDTEGVACCDCPWEGDRSELVLLLVTP